MLFPTSAYSLNNLPYWILWGPKGVPLFLPISSAWLNLNTTWEPFKVQFVMLVSHDLAIESATQASTASHSYLILICVILPRNTFTTNCGWSWQSQTWRYTIWVTMTTNKHGRVLHDCLCATWLCGFNWHNFTWFMFITKCCWPWQCKTSKCMIWVTMTTIKYGGFFTLCYYLYASLCQVSRMATQYIKPVS